jgi:putative acetyltransferase
VISVDDPRADDVRDLLARHLAFAHETALKPEDIYALDVDGLVDPAVTFFSYRADGQVLGVAALKQIDDQHAEIKSMHTAEEARGKGIARALLDHVMGVARERGYKRLSLETASTPPFAPARNLYASAGFEPCEPFADYRLDPNSTCMTRAL